MKKAIHIVNIDNFFPELWELTYPTIKAYSDRINADLNIISKRYYSLYCQDKLSVNFEKMQVWRDGSNYDANFLLDADVLIHNKFPDFTTIVPNHHIGFNHNYHASTKFNIEDNIYFQRDGRDVGIASNAVVAYKSTHEIFKPNSIQISDIPDICKVREGDIDEYNLSLNLAKYGLKYTGICWESWQEYYFQHIGTGDREQALKIANNVLTTWRNDG